MLCTFIVCLIPSHSNLIDVSRFSPWMYLFIICKASFKLHILSPWLTLDFVTVTVDKYFVKMSLPRRARFFNLWKTPRLALALDTYDIIKSEQKDCEWIERHFRGKRFPWKLTSRFAFVNGWMNELVPELFDSLMHRLCMQTVFILWSSMVYFISNCI